MIQCLVGGLYYGGTGLSGLMWMGGSVLGIFGFLLIGVSLLLAAGCYKGLFEKYGISVKLVLLQTAIFVTAFLAVGLETPLMANVVVVVGIVVILLMMDFCSFVEVNEEELRLEKDGSRVLSAYCESDFFLWFFEWFRLWRARRRSGNAGDAGGSPPSSSEG